MEDIRRCKKRGRHGLSWTSARQALAKTVALGGGTMRRFGAIRAGGFLRVESAGGYKTVAGAYFRGRVACALCDPKLILGAKTLDPKGDAYCGS